MEHMADHEQIFLQMMMKSLQKDEFGNVIFEIEASNENLDAEGQRVLQTALLKNTAYFLKNGVVSKDHKHRTFNQNGTYNIHEEFIIGEPLDVYTKGTSTRIKGKLFPNNEYAQKFIKLLEAGSSRVKASVGGLFPKIKKVIESGKEVGEIVSVLWDDLALTITPVNPTVEHGVSMAKSLSSVEFVKALSAGHGTDSATFTGGRALTKEDVGYAKNLLTVNEKVIASLVGALADGDVTGEDEAEAFLIDFGISKSDACEIVQAVCRKSNLFMEVFPMARKAGQTWDEIRNFLSKSFGGGKPENDDVPDEIGGEPTDNGEGFVDATDALNKAIEKIEALEGTIEIMAKSLVATLEKLEQSEVMQKSMGQGILALMERTEEVIASPSPRKGAVTQLETMLAKSNAGGTDGGSFTGRGIRRFTESTVEKTKNLLTKAVSDGEIDLITAGKFETQMNKSCNQGFNAFSDDFVEFLQKHVK
jgi:hypothetical protein